MGHAKVVLASRIDWQFLSKELGAVYTDGPGQPPLPARLMAGLHILKHADNLSDEEVCGRWLENPYYQYSVARSFSVTGFLWTARRGPVGASAWASSV